MPDPTPTNPRRSLPLLAGAGVFVMLLGFGLPKLLTPASPEPAPKAEVASPAPASVAPPPAAPAAGPGLGMSLLRLVVSLVVVCGLCVLAARYLGPRPAEKAAGAMEFLASLPVGPQCAVHLVRAGGRRLLIGTDPGGVKALVELPGPEPAHEAAPPAEAASTPESAPTVLGPVSVPVPPSDGDAILTLLARIRNTTPADAAPPG
jgi:flagellar biogenesis protein FliO